MTASAFKASRTAVMRTSNTPVVAVEGLGDAAWEIPGSGTLFVHAGLLEIVVSAPGIAPSPLRRLGDEVFAHYPR